MEILSRRRFVGLFVKTLGILSVAPSAFLKPEGLLSAELSAADAPKPLPARPLTPAEPFQRTLSRATKTNLRQVLAGAPLSPEEKLAIVAVRELKRSEIEAVLARSGSGNQRIGSQSDGSDCGKGCGKSCGSMCGEECPHGSNGVFDRNGLLGIGIKNINGEIFRTKVRKALALLQ
jgi:hypothetical protein